VLGTSLLWRSTVAFTYLEVQSAKCLCLLPVVLVLRIWSCLHHWYRIVYDKFITRLLLSTAMKEFCRSVNIRRSWDKVAIIPGLSSTVLYLGTCPEINYVLDVILSDVSLENTHNVLVILGNFQFIHVCFTLSAFDVFCIYGDTKLSL